MTKQFVVALRKGSATGPIVAVTNQITLVQGSNIITAGDFVDGRLTGRVLINDNVGAFSKASLPLPTTTTTTTTTLPPGPAPFLTANLVPNSLAMDGVQTTKLSFTANNSYRVNLIVGNSSLLLANTTNTSSTLSGNITFGPYTVADRPGIFRGTVVATGPNGTTAELLALLLSYPNEYIRITPKSVAANDSANIRVFGVPNSQATITSNSRAWTTSTVTLNSVGIYETAVTDTNIGTYYYQATFAATGAVRKDTYEVVYSYLQEGAVQADRYADGRGFISGSSLGGGIVAGSIIGFGRAGGNLETPDTGLGTGAPITEYREDKVNGIPSGKWYPVDRNNDTGYTDTPVYREYPVENDEGEVIGITYVFSDGTQITIDIKGDLISIAPSSTPISERYDPTFIDRTDYGEDNAAIGGALVAGPDDARDFDYVDGGSNYSTVDPTNFGQDDTAIGASIPNEFIGDPFNRNPLFGDELKIFSQTSLV